MGDYYVDATLGDDSGTGAVGDPWKTISKVNAQSLSAGDNVYFKKGEMWLEELTVPSSGSSGSVITFGAYDSGADPIIKGADDVTGVAGDWTDEGSNVWSRTLATECHAVIFDSTNYGTEDSTPDAQYEWDWSSNKLYVYSVGNPTGYYTTVEATQRYACIYNYGKDYVSFEDLALLMGDYRGFHATNAATYNTLDGLTISYAGYHGVRFYNTSSNCTIQNCTINYNGSSGIDYSDADNFTIDTNTIYTNGKRLDQQYANGIGGNGTTGVISNNTVYDNCHATTKGYGHGIYITAGTGTVQIYGNEVYSNPNGNGIYLKCSCIVYQNKSYSNYHAGIAIYNWLANNITISIYYNLIYDNYYGFILTEPGTGSIDLSLYNNAFYDNTRTDYGSNHMEIYINDDPETFAMKNNAIDHTTATASTWAVCISGTLTNTVVDYNCVNVGNLYYNGSNRTWAYWTETLAFDVNGMNDDPEWVDPANGDFQIQSTSPCRNAGTGVGLSEDYYGNTVPQETIPDIGAHEYVESSALSISVFERRG